MVFTFRCATAIPRMPLLIEPAGTYVRSEGEGFICGLAPEAHEDPDPGEDFEPDWDLVRGARIWPVMAARVPAFEEHVPPAAPGPATTTSPCSTTTR